MALPGHNTMARYVCIPDACSSRLRYHLVGAVSPDLRVWQTLCGPEIDPLWGIRSIRRQRAEAMGATPCRRCFKDGDA